MPSPNPILPFTTKKVSSSNDNSSFLDPSPLISPPKPQILDYPQPRLLIAPHSDEQIQISTTLATTTTNTAISPSDSYQQRRRRISSDSSLPSLFDSSAPRQSVSSHVSQAPAERHLITKLFVKLFSCLRVGYRVITLCLALGCYNLMLLPGFIQVGCYYFSSKQILRGIVYGGDRPRNRLDLYLPKNIDTPKPVVAFVTGGAWIIGYKAWGALLGKQLSERDIIVACIDYRNFPQSTISDMVKDASEGISFVFNKIAQYGGDPNRIYLMGQSAGAHISACALVEQAIKEANQEEISWSVSQIKAYFGLSGGYNLFNLAEHFDSRGFYRSLFVRIMEGEESLARFSPEVMVQDPNLKTAVSLLPPIFLFHGSADYTILSDQSTNFAETLKRVGFRAETILYEGKTHTDVFVQDPMRGGKDQMLEDLVAVIHADDAEAQAKDAVAPRGKRMVPECMIQIARKVSPF